MPIKAHSTPIAGATLPTDTLDAMSVKSRQLVALLAVMMGTQNASRLENFDSFSSDIRESYIELAASLAADLVELVDSDGGAI